MIAAVVYILLWVSALEFNVPFQHKHGYIRDEYFIVKCFVSCDSERHHAIAEQTAEDGYFKGYQMLLFELYALTLVGP